MRPTDEPTTPESMLAWAVERPGPIDGHPLVAVERPVPEPGPGEVRFSVTRAGCAAPTSTWPRVTCRPVARVSCPAIRSSAWSMPSVREQRPLPARRPGRDRLAPAHVRGLPVLPSRRREPVRRLRASPAGTPTAATRSTPSSPQPSPTDARTASPTARLRPLLCAGIIGYRALRRADLPPGGRLGIYGFGSTAHITAQVARARGAELHVLTRGRAGARAGPRLGAASVGGAEDAPPEPLDSAVLFAPAGELVPARPSRPSTAAAPSPSPAST